MQPAQQEGLLPASPATTGAGCTPMPCPSLLLHRPQRCHLPTPVLLSCAEKCHMSCHEIYPRSVSELTFYSGCF